MIANSLKNITPSYTIEINKKVAELKQQGKNIINFSIGEPDFSMPVNARDAGIQALKESKTKYDKVSGLNEMRTAIKNKLKNENQLDYSIDEIVVSNGAKHAITNTLMALLNHGDEVLIPIPYWVSYPEMVKLMGGIPIFVESSKSEGYKITPKLIEANISSKTKLLFLTNPSNPSGVVYSENELLAIGNCCVKNNIYILSDEIYERISFDSPFVSIASLSDTIKDITITINGLSKSLAMPGMRIGYSASNKEIAKAISTIQGHLLSHPATISQWCAVEGLNQCQEDIEMMKKAYEKRRDLAVEILDTIPNLTYVKPQGAFYLFIDISYYKKFIDFKDSFSVAFCNELLNQVSIAVVPGIAFGMDDFIRISYACDIEMLEDGLKKIKNYLKNLI